MFLFWAALPTATGALAGLAAVAVAFGSIHGITLGFGLTLIGEAVDYAVYVQVQRQRENNKYLWRGLWLAMLTSSAGFVAMMLSGFAGLMQLGLMSIVGIAVAASFARFCLPDVLRPLDPSRLARFAPLARFSMRAPRLRIALIVIGAASAILLVTRGDRLWNDQLAAISPLARGSGELDARLRSDTGLGDLRFVLAVEGATRDEAIARAEALHEPLNTLKSRGALAGFDSPAALIPSLATQQARRAALPDAATLRERLTRALADSALRAEAFEPFIADVQRARELVIGPDYYAGTALGQRVAAQLVERKVATGSDAVALITLTGVADGAAVAAELKGASGASLIDMTNVQLLVADYRARAAWAAVGGGALIVLILAVQLRNLRATARIAVAVAVSMAITAAALVLIEGGLTLFHLVALLLAAGISTNYALFIGMPRDDRQPESATDSLPVTLSVTLAAGTTLIAFATLAMIDDSGVAHDRRDRSHGGEHCMGRQHGARRRSGASVRGGMRFDPVAISAHTATTAVGRGHGALLEALRTRRGGLKRYQARRDFASDINGPALDTWIGEVEGLHSIRLPQQWSRYDCRNNRLAWLGLHQDEFVAKARAAVARYGAARVAVIIGTSTSGIAHAESAYRARDSEGRLAGIFQLLDNAE